MNNQNKNSIDELLNKKNDNLNEPNEQQSDNDDTNDLKKRMQKVINASKKLDNDLLDDGSAEAKKNLLKEKLAKAREQENDTITEDDERHSDEEYKDIDDLDELVKAKKAKYLADKAKKEENEIQEEVKDEANDSSIEDVKEEEQEIIEEDDKEIKEDVKEIRETDKEKRDKFYARLSKNFYLSIQGIILGLVPTLFFGTLVGYLVTFINDDNIKGYFEIFSFALMFVMPIGVSSAIACKLDLRKDKILASVLIGCIICVWSMKNSFLTLDHSYDFEYIDVIVVYFIVMIVIIVMEELFRRKTKVDYIIVPLFASLLAFALCRLISDNCNPYIISVIELIPLDATLLRLVSGLIITIIVIIIEIVSLIKKHKKSC